MSSIIRFVTKAQKPEPHNKLKSSNKTPSVLSKKESSNLHRADSLLQHASLRLNSEGTFQCLSREVLTVARGTIVRNGNQKIWKHRYSFV